ncbi:UNVERIFIED_CONTAM: hypothetical protein FKN15_027813 [Acipenser sinensis]
MPKGYLLLRNIVSTVNLGCKLDLKTIALRARNAEYNPKVRVEYILHNCQKLHITARASCTGSDVNAEVQYWNIVSTVNLGCKLDLKTIALRARNAEYNPKVRVEYILHNCQKLHITARASCTGSDVNAEVQYCEEQSRLAARKYARVVQKLGFPAKFLDFKIQNMVGSCDVKFPIRLEGLVLTHQQFSSYEPELFPGLIYRMIKPRIVLLIFVSGKVVLTGKI